MKKWVVVLVANLITLNLVLGETYDYQAEFAALSAEIERYANQPPPKSTVGEYLQEMDRKAQQREKHSLW